MEFRKYMNPPEPLYDIKKIRYHIGLVLRHERKIRHMTQVQLAVKAEYSPSVIGTTEIGVNPDMRLGNFLKTMNALGMTADEFLGKCQQKEYWK